MFDDRAIGRQVAAQGAQSAFRRQRSVERANDVRIADLGGGDVLRQRAAGHGEGVAMQQRQQLFQHSGNAAGVEEVFHLILAAGAHVGDQGTAAADLIKAREGQIDADAPGDGGQVDDGVGAAADGVEQGDGVVKGLSGQDLRWADVALDKLDDVSARRLRQLQMRRESAAGVAPLPGSAMPSASISEFMVEAVPMTMQWPALRTRFSSTPL